MFDLFVLRAHPATARIIDVLTSILLGAGVMFGTTLVVATIGFLLTSFSLGLVGVSIFAVVYAWMIGEAIR